MSLYANLGSKNIIKSEKLLTLQSVSNGYIYKNGQCHPGLTCIFNDSQHGMPPHFAGYCHNA